MKTIDNTQGNRPKENQEFDLTVEFNNGSRYSYSGLTKKECLNKFKQKWGNLKGFVSLEWNIYDSELNGYVDFNNKTKKEHPTE